jgi:hypothetical protein
MRKGTDLPSSSPEKLVSVLHSGVSARDSATVDPRGVLAGGAGDCLMTVPGIEPGAGTRESE